MNDRRLGIVIFRIQLLPRSETFIANQAAAMRKFEPYFVGWRRTGGLELPDSRIWTANDGAGGKLKELRFRYLGPSHSQINHIKSISPRLVYAHFALDGYAAMRLARSLNIPLVNALHGYDVTMDDEALGSTRLGREYLKGRAKIQKEAVLFVACSEYVRRRAIERGYPADRTIVHSIGVDVNRFSATSAGQREQVVLFVGRLVEKKGCDCLIEAMAMVQRSGEDAELVVIGEGPHRAKYERLAASRQLRCRFLGAQPSAIVQQWMAKAKIFCVPSRIASSGDAEGFGIVFIEAQAMGLPVVSTRSGGIPEAVEDGKTGLLVEENNEKKLAEAILKLIRDEKLWRLASLAGRERVVKYFNLEIQTNILEHVFTKLISSRDSQANYSQTCSDVANIHSKYVPVYPDAHTQDSFPAATPEIDEKQLRGKEFDQ